MELNKVYDELIRDDQSKKLLEAFYSNKMEKLILVCIGLCICVLILFSVIPYTREFMGYPIITVFCLIIFYTLSTTLSNIKFILNPTKHYVTDLSSRVTKEKILLSRLIAYDHWTLAKAKERIEFESQKLEKRIGALVGALDKLGMIPAIFALYITYSKMIDDSLFTEVPYLVLSFLAGIYLAAFSSIQIIGRLNTMAYIIGVAEELALQADLITVDH